VPDKRRVLNLVTNPAVNTEADFVELAGWVEDVDPETRVELLPDAAAADIAANVPDLPTLTVSFAPARKLRPQRGPLLMGKHVPKSVEYAALEALELPVPRWLRLLPGQRPDLSSFAEHVVTKPDFGARGAEVRVERRDLLEWTPPRTELAERFGGHFNPRIVQEFVYTGPWPQSYRVATLFGTAIFGLRIEASHTRAPLSDPRSFHGQSVVSSGRGCSMALSADPDVIALAERAHAAFPLVPLLGVDILRGADTGRLFVLELNSIGYTWHFSSPSGLKLQAEFGLDLNAQLDGRRRAAAILARACQAHAR
jgi:hypothetical protein